MKKSIYILIFLIFSTGTLFSQNGKVWEFDTEPIVIRDVEFLTDTTYVEILEDFSQFLVIVNLEDGSGLKTPVQFDFYPAWDVEVAKEQELIFVASADEIYFYDFNLQLVDSFKVEEFEAEGDFKITLIDFFAVNPDNNQIAINQSKISNDDEDLRRVLIYNYENEELLKIIETDNLYKGLEYTNDGKYLILAEMYSPNRIKFINSKTIEEEFEVQFDNSSESTTLYSGVHNSWNSKYISLVYYSKGIFDVFVYDIETEKSYDFQLEEYFGWLFETTFIDDDHLLVLGRNEDQEEIGIVFSFPELDSIFTLPPTMGTNDVKFNPNNHLILSYSNTHENLSRYNPNYTSVEIDNQADGMSIYPNPVANKLILNTEIAEEINYSIIDINGREVLNGAITENIIDVSRLNSGIYFLKYRNGKDQVIEKFIKKGE